MKIDDFKRMVDELSDFIGSLVKIRGENQSQKRLFDDYDNKDELAQKLDVLERAIELVRIRFRCIDNNLGFGKFLQSEIAAKHELLSVYHSMLKKTDITKKEKKCISIVEELENDKDVMNLFKKLSLDLKGGNLKVL